jgi:endonuclease/exonuclease/phosphatase family metal-dependent hydrolase
MSCRLVVPDQARPVRWISTEGHDTAELARWCDSVGPAFLTSRATLAPALDRLVVVSWNVHVGGGDVDGLIARLERGDFTAGRAVREYVLLLQEEFRDGDDVPPVLPRTFRPPARIAPLTPGRLREDVRRLASAHALSVVYVPSMRNGGLVRPFEDRGNAVLSTLPLQDATAIELPLERQRRVAVASVVSGRTSAGASWSLRLVDVHLDTAVALWHGGPFAARRRQAAALVQALEGRDTPTLVAGDFNTWGGSHESALDVLRAAFPNPANSESQIPNPDSQPTFLGPAGLRWKLDHVFVRGVRTVEVRRLDDRFGSDHFPVLVEVGF